MSPVDSEDPHVGDFMLRMLAPDTCRGDAESCAAGWVTEPSLPCGQEDTCTDGREEASCLSGAVLLSSQS